MRHVRPGPPRDLVYHVLLYSLYVVRCHGPATSEFKSPKQSHNQPLSLDAAHRLTHDTARITSPLIVMVSSLVSGNSLSCVIERRAVAHMRHLRRISRTFCFSVCFSGQTCYGFFAVANRPSRSGNTPAPQVLRTVPVCAELLCGRRRPCDSGIRACWLDTMSATNA